MNDDDDSRCRRGSCMLMMMQASAVFLVFFSVIKSKDNFLPSFFLHHSLFCHYIIRLIKLQTNVVLCNWDAVEWFLSLLYI